MKINPHVLTWSTSLGIVAAMSIVTLAIGQATHPSENYPGKGGAQDQTNAAPNSPEQVNPSTGQQNTQPTHGSGQ